MDFSRQRSIDYPAAENHAALFTFLEELANFGKLQHVDMNILITAPADVKPGDGEEATEVEKIRDMFAPLLESGALEVELVIQRWIFEYGRHEVVMQITA